MLETAQSFIWTKHPNVTDSQPVAITLVGIASNAEAL